MTETTYTEDELRARPWLSLKGTRILAVASIAGGVSKSTMARSVAAFAARFGCRVLLIDTDPQADSAKGFLPVDFTVTPVKGLSEVIMGSVRNIREVIRPAELKGVFVHEGGKLDIVAPGMLMNSADIMIATQPGGTGLVLQHITPIMDDYDLIVFDTRPSPVRMNEAVMIASSHLLIPTEPTLKGIDSVTATLMNAASVATSKPGAPAPNPDLEILGVIPSIVTPPNPVTGFVEGEREALEVMHQRFSNVMWRTVDDKPFYVYRYAAVGNLASRRADVSQSGFMRFPGRVFFDITCRVLLCDSAVCSMSVSSDDLRR